MGEEDDRGYVNPIDEEHSLRPSNFFLITRAKTVISVCFPEYSALLDCMFGIGFSYKLFEIYRVTSNSRTS